MCNASFILILDAMLSIVVENSATPVPSIVKVESFPAEFPVRGHLGLCLVSSEGLFY